jgi:hypothetical protein
LRCDRHGAFAVFVALVQWIAKMFGGKGNNDKLAYTAAAIAAPYSLVSGVFVLLSAIPYVGFCFRIILALAGLYIIVLEIMAVKAVNQFGWGQAIGSYFIPGLTLLLICCCVAAIVGSITGLALGNVWSTINQSLAPDAGAPGRARVSIIAEPGLPPRRESFERRCAAHSRKPRGSGRLASLPAPCGGGYLS